MAEIVREPTEQNATSRGINVLLGIWLFISAFIWAHSEAQRTNTWIVGVLFVIFGLIAMRVPPVRYLNTLLAIWLFISAFALPSVNIGTVWNNAIVAIIVFIVSLVPAAAGTVYNRRVPPQPV